MAAQLSTPFYQDFLEILIAEIGLETARLLLEKANLSADLLDKQTAHTMSLETSAVNFAAIQGALRSYYGRGTRGTLLRVGRILFQYQLEKIGFADKVWANLIKLFPLSFRGKQALDFAAHLLRNNGIDISTHTLDLDLLLVDRTSPSTTNQRETSSICFITQGFIQETFYWASGREQDVDEIHCKATGHATCEFRITMKV